MTIQTPHQVWNSSMNWKRKRLFLIVAFQMRWNPSNLKTQHWHNFTPDFFHEYPPALTLLTLNMLNCFKYHKRYIHVFTFHIIFLPPSWRHAHAHFGFAHRQQPLRWLKPFLKHWYVKLYELIAPHTLKWINSVLKLGHFVWNIIYCLSRIKFKDRWVLFFIYDSFCWTKSPTAASLGSRNDAM